MHDNVTRAHMSDINSDTPHSFSAPALPGAAANDSSDPTYSEIVYGERYLHPLSAAVVQLVIAALPGQPLPQRIAIHRCKAGALPRSGIKARIEAVDANRKRCLISVGNFGELRFRTFDGTINDEKPDIGNRIDPAHPLARRVAALDLDGMGPAAVHLTLHLG